MVALKTRNVTKAILRQLIITMIALFLLSFLRIMQKSYLQFGKNWKIMQGWDSELTLPKDPCPKTRRRSNWSDDAFSQPSLVTSVTSNSETTGSGSESCKHCFLVFSRFSRLDLEGATVLELITDWWLPSSSVVDVSSVELVLRSC